MFIIPNVTELSGTVNRPQTTAVPLHKSVNVVTKPAHSGIALLSEVHSSVVTVCHHCNKNSGMFIAYRRTKRFYHQSTIINRQSRMKTTQPMNNKPMHLVPFSFLLICSLLLPGLSQAAVREHHFQIEFAFDHQAIPDKTVVGYHLYKEGELACDLAAEASNLLECSITSDTGKFDFTMAAIYDDGSTSPESEPFTYTVVDETSPLLGLMVLTGQSPQNIDGLGEMAGDSSVDLADVISLLQQQSN